MKQAMKGERQIENSVLRRWKRKRSALSPEKADRPIHAESRRKRGDVEDEIAAFDAPASKTTKAKRAMKPSALFAFLLLLLFIAQGCVAQSFEEGQRGQAVHQKEDAPWRAHALSLIIDGYTYKGKQTIRTKTSGTGIWIANDLLLTNFHVVLRSRKISGTDDFGRQYIFRRIVALDMKNDLAVLQCENCENAQPITIARKPDDPKRMQDLRVYGVGNTGRFGLRFFRGRIIDVTSIDEKDVIMHTLAISHGASGGPLYSMADGKLLGINKSRNPILNFSVAVPSWEFGKVLSLAKVNTALSLETVFNPDRKYFESLYKRRLCLPPGKPSHYSFVSLNAFDLLVQVEPVEPTIPYALSLLDHEGRMLHHEFAYQSLTNAFSIPQFGSFVVALANLSSQREEICVDLTLGRIAWKKRLAMLGLSTKSLVAKSPEKNNASVQSSTQ